MLGLRMADGVDLDEAARAPRRRRLDRRSATEPRRWLVERGRVVRDGRAAPRPRAAWLWTDDTAARLF